MVSDLSVLMAEEEIRMQWALLCKGRFEAEAKESGLLMLTNYMNHSKTSLGIRMFPTGAGSISGSETMIDVFKAMGGVCLVSTTVL